MLRLRAERGLGVFSPGRKAVAQGRTYCSIGSESGIYDTGIGYHIRRYSRGVSRDEVLLVEMDTAPRQSRLLADGKCIDFII